MARGENSGLPEGGLVKGGKSLQTALYVLHLVAWAVATLAVAGALLFVLRVIVAWVSKNPFGWLAYNLRRVTEPVVMPLRQPFSGYYMRFDMLPLVAGAMVLFTGLFIADTLWRIETILGNVYIVGTYYRFTLGYLLSRLVLFAGLGYEVAIFARVVLPWFGVGYGSPLLRFLFRITEPLLRPIRRLLSRILSVSIFDFTPIIALFLVRVATGILADIVSRLIP